MKHKLIIAASLVLVFIAGMLDGTRDTLQFHYEQSIFPRGKEERFLGQGEQFWNPAISWRNKYENGDPKQGNRFLGSSTFLVFLTDGWHFLQFLELTCFYLAIALPLLLLLGLNLWWAVLAIIPFRLGFSAGFTLLYSYLLIRRRGQA